MRSEQRKNKVLESKYLPEKYKESYLKRFRNLKNIEEEKKLNDFLDSLNASFVFKIKEG